MSFLVLASYVVGTGACHIRTAMSTSRTLVPGKELNSQKQMIKPPLQVSSYMRDSCHDCGPASQTLPCSALYLGSLGGTPRRAHLMWGCLHPGLGKNRVCRPLPTNMHGHSTGWQCNPSSESQTPVFLACKCGPPITPFENVCDMGKSSGNTLLLCGTALFVNSLIKLQSDVW